MTPRGPLGQLVIHQPVQLAEGLLGNTSPIVLRPASNLRIQNGDKSGLRCTPVLTNDLSYLCRVSLHCLIARCDEGFEARLSSIGAGTVLAHLVLTDVEAKKVETDFPFMLAQRVSDAGLGEFEVQAYSRQPGFGTSSPFLQRLQVLAQGDQVIRISDNADPVAAGDCRYRLFETMQGDVGQ